MNKKYHIVFIFEIKNNIFVKINFTKSISIKMLEEKFFAIFKSYINDLVDVAVKNTLKEYGFDNKENDPDRKKQEEQEKKYQEQERKYQEQEKQKQQNQKQETKQETKKTPFDEFQEQFNKYKKYSDKFEEDDKKTTDNNQKKTNDYQKDYKSDNQQKTTRVPTPTELEQQYYSRLGITSAATWEQIKAGYKSEMKKFHPDKYASEPEKQKAAEVISQKINEAYHYFEKKFKK